MTPDHRARVQLVVLVVAMLIVMFGGVVIVNASTASGSIARRIGYIASGLLLVGLTAPYIRTYLRLNRLERF